MNDKELLKMVKSFRKGILNGEPPKSMCFKVCWPLHSFLVAQGIICDLVECGILINSEIHQHYFLKLSDGRVLDPTASQFPMPNGDKMPDIYLGERPVWYQVLRNGRYSEGILSRPKRRAK